MELYQEIAEKIKEADGILIGPATGFRLPRAITSLQMTNAFSGIFQIFSRNTASRV